MSDDVFDDIADVYEAIIDGQKRLDNEVDEIDKIVRGARASIAQFFGDYHEHAYCRDGSMDLIAVSQR